MNKDECVQHTIDIHTAEDHRKLADPGGERIPDSLEEQQEEQHVEDGASDEPYEPISVNLCTTHNI